VLQDTAHDRRFYKHVAIVEGCFRSAGQVLRGGARDANRRNVNRLRRALRKQTRLWGLYPGGAIVQAESPAPLTPPRRPPVVVLEQAAKSLSRIDDALSLRLCPTEVVHRSQEEAVRTRNCGIEQPQCKGAWNQVSRNECAQSLRRHDP
jgi:hypothetical protein